MSFSRVALTFILLFSAVTARALQVTLLTPIKVRLIQGKEALDYDAQGTSYVLKAGSVVEIPDAVLVKNSDGSVDFLASLNNWVNNPEHQGNFNGQAGNFMLHNKGEIAGTEAKPLVPVKVILAAEGSVVPANGIAHLGLAPMAIMERLQVTNPPVQVSTPQLLDGNPAVTIEDVADDTLNPNFVVPMPPLDRPAQVEGLTDVINQGNQAASEVGTQAAVCTTGNCADVVAGKEEPGTIACEYVFRNGFPGDLADTHASKHDDYVVIAEWFQSMMAVPAACKDACPTQNAANLQNLTNACSVLKSCNTDCSTPKIDGFWCRNGYSSEEEDCKDKCSPFRGMTYNQRSKEIKAAYKRAFNDLSANSPNLGAKMKKSGGGDTQAMRMACLNKIRENPDLEPMDANCDSSALGFGQVLKGTFYETLGLSTQNLSRCGDIPISELKSKCRGFLTDMARLDVYNGKYDQLTPKQLFHRRAFDIDIQVRSSYAAWVNKMKYADFDANAAFYLWFGQRDSSKRSQINTCTDNGAA